MERVHWRQFIGLPHRTGANPRTDDAADCLLVAFAVLDELGLPHPPVDPLWFEMAGRGMWRELGEMFDHLTVPDDGKCGAVAMLQSGTIVAIDRGVLLTRHRDGVQWLPMEMLGPRKWRRFW